MLARSRVLAVGAMLGASTLLLVSCDRAPHASSTPTAAPTAQPAPPASSAPAPSAPALPPLGGDWLVRLPLEGFREAVIAAPIGTTSPRPILIGVHGSRDRPEWACGEFLGVTKGYPFILCPHGIPLRSGPEPLFGFATSEELEREIDAGLKALRERFGPYVAEGPMIYGGFSRGAFLGVPIVADDPARFPVVVLGEGGQSSWTDDRAVRFARGGGKRVLFVCSTAACETATPPALAILKRAGVEAKMITAGHIGHIVDDRVVTLIRGSWPWLVRDRTGPLGPW
ncbi:hypothetical protein [Polyangium jinanense]|uniref:Alpha/beta hydrolase n=1 Tax=Polyangium jinanense TaxID=2829994 RepID=A0A9X3XCD6_9BACT|nr:hypothetical protein [Polyangium jinanense]MDC3960420.1 hypothetical protein [Polyangium jinanense]MDC3985336.1 hypothetical protein [Polyangium jinanense]